MQRKKRILIAPLDWGIGHATRCIPIIKALIKNNYQVIIAADKRPLSLLNIEFPKLDIIRLNGYNIRYSKYLPMSINLCLQIPKMIWGIKQEEKILDQIITDYQIDGVISDNRFGLYSKRIPCVFITHQLKINSPYFTETIQNLNYKYINKFNKCWIMDEEQNNLAGELSKTDIMPRDFTYIGRHSRFKYQERKKIYDFLGIISGPEPQRTILEKGLIKALKNRSEKSLIILGKPEIETTQKIGNLTIKSHLDANSLNNIILESKLIICRSGYSTIMDLEKLHKKAFFIPTPGQTEQEYLAKILASKKICYFQEQNNFDFDKGITESKKYTGFSIKENVKHDWDELFSLF